MTRVFLALALAFLSVASAAAADVGLFIRSGTSSISSPVSGRTFVLDYSATPPQLKAYSGSSYVQLTPPRGNYAATSVPSSSNDSSQGYAAGSIWVNTLTHTVYTCTDPTASAAVWIAAGASSSSPFPPTGSIEISPIHFTPSYGTAISPDGKFLYSCGHLASDHTHGGIVKIDVPTGAVLSTLDLGADSHPSMLLVNSAGTHCYVFNTDPANRMSSTLYDVATADLSLANAVTLENGPYVDYYDSNVSVDLSPDGSTLAFATGQDDNVYLMDTASYAVTSFPAGNSVTDGQPAAAVCFADSADDSIYVAYTGIGDVDKYSASGSYDSTLSTGVSGSPNFLGMRSFDNSISDGHELFISDAQGYVISLTANETQISIRSVPSDVEGMSMNPASGFCTLTAFGGIYEAGPGVFSAVPVPVSINEFYAPSYIRSVAVLPDYSNQVFAVSNGATLSRLWSIPSNVISTVSLNIPSSNSSTWTQRGSSARLVPNAAGRNGIGTASLPFSKMYIGNAATNNTQITCGTLTDARTFTMPDADSNPVVPSTAPSPGQFVTGIGSDGVITYETPAGGLASVTGTTNQIDSTGGSTPVLTLSSTLVTPGSVEITTDLTVDGNSNVGTVTSGTWTGSRIGTSYLDAGIVSGAGSLIPLFSCTITDGELDFTPITVGAHKFYGNNTGSTATPDFYQVDFSDLSGTASTGQIPDLSATYSPIAGNSSLVTLGTIGTGTWQGTAVGTAYGGTGNAFGGSNITGTQTITTTTTLTATSANYLFSDGTARTVNMPEASTCAGKVFYFFGAQSVAKQGSDTIIGSSTTQCLGTATDDSFALISDGVNNWSYYQLPFKNIQQSASVAQFMLWDGNRISLKARAASSTLPVLDGTLFGGSTSLNAEGTTNTTASTLSLATTGTVLQALDSTSNSITVTLPEASSSSAKHVKFYRKSASNTVTIQRAGSDTIDGSTSFTLPAYVGACAELSRDSVTSAWDTTQPALVAGTNIALTASAGNLTIATTGLAASATTDTTVASNISSGTLNAARLPTAIYAPCVLSNIPLTTASAGVKYYQCQEGSGISAVDTGSTVNYYSPSGVALTPPVYGSLTNYGATSGITFTSGTVLGFTVYNPLTGNNASNVSLTGHSLTTSSNQYTVTVGLVGSFPDQRYPMFGLAIWNAGGSSSYRTIIIDLEDSAAPLAGNPGTVKVQTATFANDFSSSSSFANNTKIALWGTPTLVNNVSGTMLDYRLVFLRIYSNGTTRYFQVSLDGGLNYTTITSEAYNATFTPDSYGIMVGDPAGTGSSATLRQVQVVHLVNSAP